ncbi:MAG TPA: hypothetical protein VHJ83_07275 [Micromonosporaceae bacterium]|nr:hypothetical protein [Micromonosporaceae bacterium]
MTSEVAGSGSSQLLRSLNGQWHRAALNIFLFIVVAHWIEHLAQVFQIWVLGMPLPASKGALGLVFPWLVTAEWLHYGYALVMLIGLLLLRPGFTGSGRTWWTVALVIQFWHHIEHLLLFVQAQADVNFFGQQVPTSLVQLVIPRVELHLFYNAVVFIPMVIGMIMHRSRTPENLRLTSCSCVHRSRHTQPAGLAA